MKIAFLSVLLLAGSATAQSISIQCIAQDQGTMWPTPGGTSNARDAAPAHAALIKLLAGQYVVDLITTEGVETPTVARWRIMVLATDTSREAFPGVGRAWRPALVGTRIDVSKPTSVDSLRRGRFVGGLADFQMNLDSATGHLSWQTAPGWLDAGWFFSVAEVDSLGFSGRWEDGGLAIAMLERGGLRVGERARGYYCARRTR
jgi:hypothetical protein